MPIGILTDVAATLAGSIAGCLISSHLSDNWKKLLNNLMGIAALVMGLVLIQRVQNLSPVIMSLLLGAGLGQGFAIEDRVSATTKSIAGKVMASTKPDAAFLAQVSAVLILFCFGGTGWYGALNEGLTGDGSILITKAILDCVSACIFAALLGKIVPCLCAPQLVVYMTLFGISGLVQPWITPSMIADFSALGGIITLVAGLRLTGIKTDIKGLNLLPGFILVFVVSGLWTALIG